MDREPGSFADWPMRAPPTILRVKARFAETAANLNLVNGHLEK